MLKIQKKLTYGFYALLALPATGMGFALCVQLSVLSWILSTRFNLDIGQVGYVWAAGPIAGILGQLIVGKISDDTWFWGGRRKPFIFIGGTLAALMIVCLPNIDKIAAFFGTSNLLPVALIVALTLDLAINVSFNPTRSLIADVTPDGKMRTRGFTVMQTVSGMFGVGAYFIAAYFGNYTLIWVGVIVVIAFSLIPINFIKEPRQLLSEEKDAVDKNSGVLDIEINKSKHNLNELVKIYIANAFSWLGVQTMFVFMFAYLLQLLFNTSDANSLTQADKDTVGKVISYAFLILNAVGFLMPSLVLEPLAKKIGSVNTQALFILVMSIAFAGIYFYATDANSLYLFMALAGMGWAAIVSLPFAIMSDKVDKTKMGFFMGVFNLSIVIPQLIVSIFVGRIMNAAEHKDILFIISAVSLFISAIIWKTVKEKKN